MKKKKYLDVSYEKKTVPAGLIVCNCKADDWDKKELKEKSAYFLINGAPEFSVNEVGNARFKLLSGDRDFYAAKEAGINEFRVRIYKFSEKNSEIFSLLQRLKTESLGAMEEAYLMQRLIKEHHLTQEDVATAIQRSRPSVANALRLLTLHPEVIGLVESGRLSAGHARTLIKVPQEKQTAFALEGLKRGYSVREMERAVKAYLTPPEILRKEKEAKSAAKGEELKSLVERLRTVLRLKVGLVGNDKKGRLYVDYFSADELARLERLVEIAEKTPEYDFEQDEM